MSPLLEEVLAKTESAGKPKRVRAKPRVKRSFTPHMDNMPSTRVVTLRDAFRAPIPPERALVLVRAA